MAVITTGSFPKELRPGVFAFTQMKYDEHKPFWPLMFNKETSHMQYEELVSGNSFGLVPQKGQGDKIKYMSESQGAVTRATHVTRAAGYIITLEEATYNLYEKLGKQRGARLAAAFPRTKDKVAADFFNGAFSGTTYGDGKTLCATDHPSLAGNYQNELTVGADLSETSVEDLCVLIRKATDNVGNKIGLQPKRLMTSSDDMFEATRILDSEFQNDTSNNAINALRFSDKIPEHFDNPYLTSSDAFFIMTDIADTDGLIYFDAIPFKLMMDNDSDTLNEKHFGFEAYSFTVGDPRAVFGSAGS